MKHINSISKLRHIDNPKGAGSTANPNLLHTLAYRVHGLPVIRLQAILYPIYLMSCLAPGFQWKSTQVIKGRAPELDGLGFYHEMIIQNFVS
ncbi:MAG: hypothetical protein ABT22_09395 [Thiobacillus sp. SCN 64-317]|nr:MAG: hypothetical protein ABT22_09395 [Thiobacillus sp. SCN 64-317]